MPDSIKQIKIRNVYATIDNVLIYIMEYINGTIKWLNYRKIMPII